MSNRYHLPVVVTTSDEMSRAEAIDYVESVLANLEESDTIHRTYVEDAGISEGEAERLLDMLKRIDDDSIENAVSTIDSITEDGENS